MLLWSAVVIYTYSLTSRRVLLPFLNNTTGLKYVMDALQGLENDCIMEKNGRNEQ